MRVAPFALMLLAVPFPVSGAAAAGSTQRANCQMAGSGAWTAHVNAMPGPNARPTLIVTGTIGVKPAARTRLRLDPAVMESDPPQYTVVLDVRLPRRPTIDMLERRQVRGAWPIRGRVGAVHIRCGGRLIASIGNVETAY